MRSWTFTALLTHSLIARSLMGATLASAAILAGCSTDGATAPNGQQAVGEDGGINFETDGGVDQLLVEPANVTLDANGAGTTQKFTARLHGQEVPATWAVDVADIGTMAADGTFSTSGFLGGPTRVIAQVGDRIAMATLTVRLKMRQIPADADPAVVAKLQAGGAADAGYKMLYPYDKTVFPRGLLPPTLQFGGGAADAFYVKAKAQNLDFEGYFKPTSGSPARLALPQDVWTAITRSAGGADPVTIEVSKISGGNVTGPAKETWNIAQGSLKGVVYYNSYDSLLARNSNPAAPAVGAVMRIRPGTSAEVFIGGANSKNLTAGQKGAGYNCTTCHSVSAQGNVINATLHTPEGSALPYNAGVFNVDNEKGATFVRQQGDAANNFGGLYPDGSLMMQNATFAQAPNWWAPNVPGINGTRPSRLVDMKTGAVVNAAGWGVDDAQMPAFSPDGKKLLFMRGAQGGTTNAAKQLWIADFDRTNNSFSGLGQLASDASRFLGWPAMTPDAKWVVYQANTRADHATWTDANATTQSELMIAHVGSKTVAKLDALNGVDENGKLYLPYGAAESQKNFMPTILPQPVGGYFWVVFTSRRNYGNVAVEGAANAPPRKKLWVAALDLDPQELPRVKAEDISHPAFFLEGQEIEAGNSRGFWSLDACKPAAAECAPGTDDCCDGFCRQKAGQDGKVTYACTTDKGLCALEGESCQSAADCCDGNAGVQCLNNKCARSTPK